MKPPVMKDSKRIVDYIPDGAAVAAAVLVVAAAVLPVSLATKIEMLAASTVMMSVGWLWTMREQRPIKREEEGPRCAPRRGEDGAGAPA